MKMQKNAGFSLVEALIAFLILSIGIAGAAKYQSYLIQNSALSKQQTEAVLLGEQKMEDFRSYETLNTTSGKFAYADIVSGTDTVTGESAIYTRTWTVTSNTSPTYKTVAITINWTSQGVVQSVSFTSFVAGVDPTTVGKLVLNSSVPASASRNASIPAAAVNLGNGTSSYTPPGTTTTLIYDNTTGVITTINNVVAHSVVGTVALVGTGSNAPVSTLSTISISASNNSGSSYCTYDGNGNYTCTVSNGWGGTITPTNTGTDVICMNFTQPLVNVTGNLTGDNFGLVQSGQSCPSGYQLSFLTNSLSPIAERGRTNPERGRTNQASNRPNTG